MSQDFNIPVASDAPMGEAREAHNDALLALRTSFDGPVEPSSPERGMIWHDSAAKKLKVRNWANTTWLDLISTDA